MSKAIEIQKQIRDNAKTLNSYMTDLQNWEAEMKRKEAAISGEFEQAIPPVRSKAKKEKPLQVKKKPEPRISSADYLSWEKFDVDKACEDIDMQDVGPVSLDSKKTISCYNRAIELVKDDAIYFANRGLCYLKKDSLHQAETDCTEALRLDPTYVKALQRRATARERLGSLRAASNDLMEVIKLEPKNKHAQSQLEQIKARMGTKGLFPKASAKPQPKIIELEDPQPKPEQLSVQNWKNGVGENRPLKPVPIQEIPLGKTSSEKHPTRLKIVEIESSNTETNEVNDNGDGDINTNKTNGDIDTEKASPESVKLITDEIASEKESRVANLVPPISSIFDNALESDVLSDVLRALHGNTHKFKQHGVSAYLSALTQCLPISWNTAKRLKTPTTVK
ncbi:TPR-repeat protein [Operophtera brumata]|uniref:TPR-repeat protein n=1 Tax=Operophtera brumata TaxID=104452 RepID=A0A0L7L8N0_OPEBR|nr:TPR-repeat protein [Operophtera brumata]